jgi:hypothetical protein
MKTLTICDIPFQLAEPFAEGHACSAGEAGFLNDAFLSAVRSNFGKRLKPRLEGLRKVRGEKATFNATEVLELRREFEQYAQGYTLGSAVRRTAFSSPLERAAHRIAQDLVRERLRERGLKPDDLADGQFAAHVAKVASRPEVLEEAKRRVDAAQLLIDDTLFDDAEQAAIGPNP